eukprot:4910597-Prymnesium_polylepis.2
MHWTDEPASASNAASGSSRLPGCCPRKQNRRDIGQHAHAFTLPHPECRTALLRKYGVETRMLHVRQLCALFGPAFPGSRASVRQ